MVKQQVTIAEKPLEICIHDIERQNTSVVREIMKKTQETYQFQSDWYTDGRSERIVIKASEPWVLQYIPLSEFGPLFGGYARWHEPRRKTRNMPGHAIGVWGRRNVSKFKRILKEQGAEFTVVDGEGPEQQLSRQFSDYESRTTRKSTLSSEAAPSAPPSER